MQCGLISFVVVVVVVFNIRVSIICSDFLINTLNINHTHGHEISV